MASDYESWVDDVIADFSGPDNESWVDGVIADFSRQNSSMFDTNRPLTIFVADKTFGSDDVVAVTLLQLLFDHSKVIRTNKKPSVAEQALQAVWLNITRSYDPEHGFFDGQCDQAKTLQFDDSVDLPGGLGICGQVWKEFGALLIQKFGAKDDDGYVLQTVYREFLHPLDYMSRATVTSPGSLIYALNAFNNIGHEDADRFLDAVMAARPLVSRVLQCHALRGNTYLTELPAMELAFTDRLDPELLVLSSRCDTVHLFLKDYDPDQDVKFIIQPRNPEQHTWQVWAVDYKRRRFNIHVPLILPEDLPEDAKPLAKAATFRGRYLAITNSKGAAIALAKYSLAAYHSDYVQRFKRWWWDV